MLYYIHLFFYFSTEASCDNSVKTVLRYLCLPLLVMIVTTQLSTLQSYSATSPTAKLQTKVTLQLLIQK